MGFRPAYTAVGLFLAAWVMASANAAECPDGARMTGAPPPDGTERGCELIENGERLRHGHWVSWYLNGQKQKEGVYHRGERRGVWNWWYPTGQKMQSGAFMDGRPVGMWLYWDENGKPQHDPSKVAGKGKDGKPLPPPQEPPNLEGFARSLEKSFK